MRWVDAEWAEWKEDMKFPANKYDTEYNLFLASETKMCFSIFAEIWKYSFHWSFIQKHSVSSIFFPDWMKNVADLISVLFSRFNVVISQLNL